MWNYALPNLVTKSDHQPTLETATMSFFMSDTPHYGVKLKHT
ncbi:hypothetical protein HMPREF1861_02027 [Corynebacterium kroppenstedtii]|nr:hypothetical protein HMPREF1861_02027 [Corynebacterium kroppenstedtii]